MKNMGSQSEILFHGILDVQKIPVGWTTFFFLALKFGRNSYKKPPCEISMVPYLLNPKLVSISDFHFNSKLKTVQMKLMKASSKPSACLPYLLVSPAWLSRDLNRLSSLLQRQLPSFTQCTHVISICGGWGSGLWWWWLYDDFDDQSTLTLQQWLCWRFLRDMVFLTSYVKLWKCSLTIGILLGCCLFCRRLCICPWLHWKIYCYLFYLVFKAKIWLASDLGTGGSTKTDEFSEKIAV